MGLGDQYPRLCILGPAHHCYKRCFFVWSDWYIVPWHICVPLKICFFNQTYFEVERVLRSHLFGEQTIIINHSDDPVFMFQVSRLIQGVHKRRRNSIAEGPPNTDGASNEDRDYIIGFTFPLEILSGFLDVSFPGWEGKVAFEAKVSCYLADKCQFSAPCPALGVVRCDVNLKMLEETSWLVHKAWHAQLAGIERRGGLDCAHSIQHLLFERQCWIEWHFAYVGWTALTSSLMHTTTLFQAEGSIPVMLLVGLMKDAMGRLEKWTLRAGSKSSSHAFLATVSYSPSLQDWIAESEGKCPQTMRHWAWKENPTLNFWWWKVPIHKCIWPHGLDLSATRGIYMKLLAAEPSACT